MEPRTSGVGQERIFSANATLAISMTVCRAGAASEVSLYTYISKLTGKPTDKFLMPVPAFNVVSGGSHAGNCLACPEILIVPTGASSVAEDMITDSEVYHTVKFGYQEDVRWDACMVGDRTGFAPSVQLNNETPDFFTECLELVQSVLPRSEWRVVSGTRSAETRCSEERFTSLESSVFWFLAEREDDASGDER